MPTASVGTRTRAIRAITSTVRSRTAASKIVRARIRGMLRLLGRILRLFMNPPRLGAHLAVVLGCRFARLLLVRPWLVAFPLHPAFPLFSPFPLFVPFPLNVASPPHVAFPL